MATGTGSRMISWCRSLRMAIVIPALGASVSHSAESSGLSVRAHTLWIFSRPDFGIGMIEVRAEVSDWLYMSFAPAVVWSGAIDPISQLRLAPTLRGARGPVVVEDRNLLVFASDGGQQYRNRLRLTVPVFGRRIRMHVMDEASYE